MLYLKNNATKLLTVHEEAWTEHRHQRGSHRRADDDCEDGHGKDVGGIPDVVGRRIFQLPDAV